MMSQFGSFSSLGTLYGAFGAGMVKSRGTKVIRTGGEGQRLCTQESQGQIRLAEMVC